jgi:hypothetical protein
VASVDEPEFSEEAFIIDEDAFVILSTQGWIKRQGSVKDLSTTRMREGDSALDVVAGSTKAVVALFSSQGACYVTRIVDIPASTGYGSPVQTLFKMADGERIVRMMSFDPRILDVPPPVETDGPLLNGNAEPEGPHALAVTKAGQCLRFSLRPHREPSTRAGRKYARLTDMALAGGADEVVYVDQTNGDEKLAAATVQGHALVCMVSEVPVLAGAGKGVRLIKIDEKDDAVIGARLMKDSNAPLVVEHENGKTFEVTVWKDVVARGGKGTPLFKRKAVRGRRQSARARGGRPRAGSQGGRMSSIKPPAKSGAYTAEQIDVLEGLEPVRKRPAMYIGGHRRMGYHHLLWEIVDNCVDEAINGHASHIEVTLEADRKGASVSDDGRGIPVDVHPKHKKTALELVLTVLHAGGKFEGKNYQVSGGLHGVGASASSTRSASRSSPRCAATAPSTAELRARHARGQAQVARASEAQGHHDPVPARPADLRQVRGTSTSSAMRERLEAKSYLHRGLIDHAQGRGQRREVGAPPPGRHRRVPRQADQRAGQAAIHPSRSPRSSRTTRASRWRSRGPRDRRERILSYANGIPTPHGGTHENGLKAALNKAVRAFMAAKKIEPKGVTITAEDIREGAGGPLQRVRRASPSSRARPRIASTTPR